MKFNTFVAPIAVAFAASVSVGAAPTPASPPKLSSSLPRPSIIYPPALIDWWGSTHHNVTWNTTNIPRGVNYPNTAIFLARNEGLVADDLPGGRNHPLAKNFSLTAGRTTIQVPDNFDGDDYQVALFVDTGSKADKGSFSDPITIRNFLD